MKKLNTLFAALLLTGSAAFAQDVWTLDKAHSNLNFTVTHLMISDVEGKFKVVDSKITSTKEDFSDAVIEFTADAKSVDTGNEKRDGHLQSADFFDVEKYPTITFKSTSLKKVEGKKYKLTGDLTAHGVTKPITFDVTLQGTAVHPYNKKTVAAFKFSGLIKRSDFGIGAGTPSGVASDEVTISGNTEFFKG